MGRAKKPKVPRQPAVEFEDFADADRVFQEFLSSPSSRLPAVDHEAEAQADLNKGERAQKRRADAGHAALDLHGLTLQQAKDHLDLRLQQLLASGTGILTVKVVTGKGLHSGPGGSVLAREIHLYVQAVYGKLIVALDDSPAEVAIRGVPLRGHFLVKLRRP